MINPKTAGAALILGFAMAFVPAPSALAQTSQERTARTHIGHDARAQASPGEIGASGMTRHRADAMRECNERANRFSQPVHGNMQSYQYWSCMMMRGERD